MNLREIKDVDQLNEEIDPKTEAEFDITKLKQFEVEYPVITKNTNDVLKPMKIDPRVLANLQKVKDPKLAKEIEDMLVDVDQEIMYNKYDSAFETLLKAINKLESYR